MSPLDAAPKAAPEILSVDHVWVADDQCTATPSRRVVAVWKTQVIYSDGGDRLRHCQTRAFWRWVQRYRARRADPRDPPPPLFQEGA